VDRQRAVSGSPFEPSVGFSRAVRIGERVVVSGTGPVVPDGECPADAGDQTRRCFEIVATALADVGASLGDVVRTRLYLTDVADADAVGRVHRELFGDVRPAATMIVVAGLLHPAWKVEVEAEAVLLKSDRQPPWPQP
jgi:enamine deaminase RidA (YjgF/YER057c/UK114 family)